MIQQEPSDATGTKRNIEQPESRKKWGFAADSYHIISRPVYISPFVLPAIVDNLRKSRLEAIPSASQVIRSAGDCARGTALEEKALAASAARRRKAPYFSIAVGFVISL